MVFTFSLISKSSSPLTNPLEIVLSAPIIVGLTITFMIHSFFISLTRSWYLVLFPLSFNFILWSTAKAKSSIQQVLYFLLIITKSGGGCPRHVMVTAMDCGIVVSEFVFQSCYYIHFGANTLGKGMNPLILPAMG